MAAGRTVEVCGLEAWELTSPCGRVAATVIPFDGGGVSSLRIGGRELLYRANDLAPPPDGGWPGRAPLLWPAVGRNYSPAALATDARGCSFEANGTTYPIPIHGFAMRRAWTALAAADDAITLGLAEDEASLACFPWPFTLRATHRVDSDGLTSTVEVTSPTGLPFCIGNHLTLSLPAVDPAAMRVCLPATRRLHLTQRGLLSGEETPIDLTGTASLADEWLHNAVVGGLSGPAELRLDCGDGRRVIISQEVSSGAELVAPEDWLFVFYGSLEKRFWCPEPWLGRPGGLQGPVGRIELPPGALFTWSMRVALEEE